jgi:hypothetical protein
VNHIWRVRLFEWKYLGSLSAYCNDDMGGGESFADDLNENGVL